MITGAHPAPLPYAISGASAPSAAGKMQVLLFSLGTREVFGVNVFKVREVKRAPPIARSPNLPAGVEGVISLRGNIIPAVNLADLAHPGAHQCSNEAIMVTEFNGHVQACLLHEVDRIVRIDWSAVHPPAPMVNCARDLVTAVAELPGGQWVSMLDLEQVLGNVFGEAGSAADDMPDEAIPGGPYHVFFADDSAIARRRITQTLSGLGLRHQHAVHGREAWDRLKAAAAAAQAEGVPLRSRLHLILLDAEMPQLDGFTLVREVKADRRFEGIPVVLLSALATDANRLHGKAVGCDDYVCKFDPGRLESILRSQLAASARTH
jgi:two-component system chemotaxis response regulator CheV